MTKRVYRYALSAHYDAWLRASEMRRTLEPNLSEWSLRPFGLKQGEINDLDRVLADEMTYHINAMRHMLADSDHMRRRRTPPELVR